MSLIKIALNSKIFENFTINNIEHMMLTDKYKMDHENKQIIDIIKPDVINNSKEKIEKQLYEFIEPTQHDSLFWCLYIISHGYNEYKQIGHNYGVKELEEKHKIFEFIKTNISAIKNTNYKITNVAIQEMSSDFIIIQKRTSYLCLIAMIVYYNINIFIVDETKNTMLEFLVSKDSNESMSYILYTNNFGKYKLVVENISTSKIIELRDKYIVLNSYLKPLKAISNYKVDELEILLKKTGNYNENQKYKKQDLYDKIIEAVYLPTL